MPIKIPSTLPARSVLEGENIFVMTEERAVSQDIRPLKILILNLMPTKIVTETQLLRLLGNSPIQVEIELIKTATYSPKNTPSEHLLTFYTTFDKIKNKKYDGMIVTGAPVEHMDFEQVAYWDELCEIIDWAKDNVYSSLYICWGAQAALYHNYSIEKIILDKKLFGIFEHKVCCPNHPLMRGFDDVFLAPHSRHTAINSKQLAQVPNLNVLAASDIAGEYIIHDPNQRSFYITGHSEYDSDTLAKEYYRDISNGLVIDLPYNYFPGNDPAKPPKLTWRAHSTLLFNNWLNYFVYQETPFDITKI